MSKRWLKARDYFMGTNYQTQDFAKALVIARTCPLDSDAVWLCSLFLEGASTDKESVMNVLFEATQTDSTGAALCFYAYVKCTLGNRRSDFDDLLNQAAACGHSYAKMRVAIFWNISDQILKYAMQDEPVAIYYAAYNAITNAMAIELHKRAAELGYIDSMIALTGFQAVDMRKTVRYLGKAAGRGVFKVLPHLIRIAHSGVSSDRFLVGEQIATKNIRSALVNDPLSSAALYYLRVRVDARSAICAWTGVARRLRVVRDIRIVIAKMLWREQIEWAQ